MSDDQGNKYAKAAAAWGGFVPQGFDKFANTNQDSWKWTNRTALALGGFLIRPASHAIFCPQGFHCFIKHKIQQDIKHPELFTPVLCTTSYAYGEPCPVCDILYDLSEYELLKKIEKTNPKLYTAVMAASAPAGGYFLIPVFVKGSWGKQKGNDGREWDTLFPHATEVVTCVMALDMKRSACNKFFGMYQELKEQDPTLDNIQFGKWLMYNKEQTSQKLSIAPKDLQRPLSKDELELIGEKKYPKIMNYGASEKDPTKDTRHSYSQGKKVFIDSWMGVELTGSDYDYDLQSVEKISHTLRPGYSLE